MSATDLLRPIIGIENRTAQEVFDIMSDRFTRAHPPATGEAVAFSASDRACYEYPGVDEQPLRAAFVAGAVAYATPVAGRGDREAVAELIKRLTYGYAVMYQAVCHMAGTSGASGRWYYDKADEAFRRVSPLHALNEDSNPHKPGDCFSGMADFLTKILPALSAPTSVAGVVIGEEGEVYTAEHLKALLDGRDDFIVRKGLWQEFCDTVEAPALASTAPPPQGISKHNDGWCGEPCPACEGSGDVTTEHSYGACGRCGGTGERFEMALDLRAESAPPPQGDRATEAEELLTEAERLANRMGATIVRDPAKIDQFINGAPPQGDLAVAIKALEPFALLAPSDVSNGVNMSDPLSKWFSIAQLVDAAEALRTLTGEKG